MNTIRIKRIYEPFSEDDGYRVLKDWLDEKIRPGCVG